MVDKWSIKPSLAEKMVDFSLFVADKEEGRNMVNNLQIWLNMLSLHSKVQYKAINIRHE